jgi:predicted metalloprotease with PDZ domain
MKEGDLAAAIEDEGGSVGRRFLRDYIEGTKELPLRQGFERAGLKLERKISDMGVDLGIRAGKQPEKIVVQSVLSGGPAEDAGISAFDEIVAVDGYRAGSEMWDRLLGEARPGRRFRLSLFRSGVLRDVMVGSRAPRAEAKLTFAPRPSAPQKKIIKDWLRQAEIRSRGK